MTAWPLNCSAADAAENVFWRRGASAAHALLIDSLAVPLRIEPETVAPAQAAPVPSTDAAETKASIGRRLARMFERTDRR
ncbi:MAG TPA: hypothetical protein VGM74_14885 [Burkholderiaceae bacterium]|jgi:hypothetical protein